MTGRIERRVALYRGRGNEFCIDRQGNRLLSHTRLCLLDQMIPRCLLWVLSLYIAVCFAAAVRAEYSGMFCRCHACHVWRYVLPLLLAAAAGCCCCCCRFECRGQHMRLYTAHRHKAANTPLSDMERRAHSWDPSPAALARGRFEGCVGALVRAFELPFAACAKAAFGARLRIYVLFASAATTPQA